MPGDGPVLLMMPDIELLDRLKITCELIGDPHESSNFNLQTIETFSSPSCRANKALQIKTDKVDANDTNANIPDYFRSSSNRDADKRASEVFTNKIYHEFSIF